MKWKNLLENKCPSCGGALYPIRKGLELDVIACSRSAKCTFRIGAQRMTAIVSRMSAATFDSTRERPAGEGWERFSDVHSDTEERSGQ